MARQRHKLPNAVAVVSALKKTARVSGDCSGNRLALSPRQHVINFERIQIQQVLIIDAQRR